MTITELAKSLDINAATLRYYESIGLITANRDARGHRDYTSQQIDRAKRVIYFRHAGVPIRNIARLFADQLDDSEAIVMMKQARQNLEHQQEKLTETLAFLEYKLNWHQEQLQKRADQKDH